MKTQMDTKSLAEYMQAVSYYLIELPYILTMSGQQSLTDWWNIKGLKIDSGSFASKWAAPNIYNIVQGWGNTSGGWESIGGSTLTDSYTTVIENELLGFIIVFYNGEPAYIAEYNDIVKGLKTKGYKYLPGIKTASKSLNILWKNKKY